jgi:hypothetical protein
MAVPRWTGWVVVGVVAAGALVKALTVYTFPSDGPGSRAIRLAITEALGEIGPRAPTGAALAALPVSGDLHTAEDTVGPRPPAIREPTVGWAARDWARAAAAADSRALRAWLEAPRLTTRSARDDSVYVTSRRVTVHAGCPLVSTIRAVLTRRPTGELHLVRLSATCPRVPAGDAVSP